MKIINLPYLMKPDSTWSIYFSFIVFIIFLTLLFYTIKSKNIKNIYFNIYKYRIVKISVLNVILGSLIISILIINALISNIIHIYEIKPKYLSIDRKNISLTVNDYPHGNRNINDIFTSTLFIEKIVTQYKKSKCEITIFTNQGNHIIPFESLSYQQCENLTYEIQKNVNISRKTDFPKLQHLLPINAYFS